MQKIVGYIIIYKDDGAYYNNLASGNGRRYDYPKLYKSYGTASAAIKNSCYVKEKDVVIKPVGIIEQPSYLDVEEFYEAD